jgi:16S rRNA (cytidine1402-2'-O)-methyltransferase
MHREKITLALYLVATPIGNLLDLSVRAQHILKSVDLIAAEDTRHTKILLHHYGIRTPTVSAHEHNEASTAHHLVQQLQSGKSVALVSDAGTPSICDPGARIVAAAHAMGIPIRVIPGPNAAISALCASGFAENNFSFLGFLPSKSTHKKVLLEKFKEAEFILVFYEAPHRIASTIQDLCTIFHPDRELVIARELSKIHETIVRLPLAEAQNWVEQNAPMRGEFVLVLSAAKTSDVKKSLSDDSQRLLLRLMQDLPLSQAVNIAADLCPEPKKLLYDYALNSAGA